MVEIVNPWALPALVSGLTGFVIALWVFSRNPGGTQHRALAMFVWTVSFGWASFYGLAALDADTLSFLALQGHTAYFSWALGLLAYLWLISTLQSPLAGRLARRPVRWTYTVLLGMVAVAYGLTPVLHASFLGLSSSLLFDIVWMGIILVGVFVAFSAWTAAPPGLLRRKNALFAIAFIVHDASLLLFLGGSAIVLYIFPEHGRLLGPWWMAVPGVATLAFQGLLLYGVLTTQLFDIDLKFRWGLSRGTMGAIFVAVFFAVSEIVTALLSPVIGVVTGILVTALLLVILAPLRRVADGLAGYLVRDATDTPAYRKRRKELVYEAQVEELMADAMISAKERRALLRLQETLGLEAAVAARLERDVLDRLLRPAPASQAARSGR